MITSSGTAVANLLPAVVEASQSCVPLLVLSADRPAELRDTGANQTIDQVRCSIFQSPSVQISSKKGFAWSAAAPCCFWSRTQSKWTVQVNIFGSYTRWAADIAAPNTAIPARSVVTTIDTATQHTLTPTSGPVHLNCQFREPLGPKQEAWPITALKVRAWSSSWAHNPRFWTALYVPSLASQPKHRLRLHYSLTSSLVTGIGDLGSHLSALQPATSCLSASCYC